MNLGTIGAASMVAFTLTASAAMAAPFAGLYVGIDAGYGWGDANQTNFGAIGGPLLSTQDDAEIDGFIAGAHIGHDWMISPTWVLGVEGGLRYNGAEGDDNFDGGDNNELSGNWDASATVRLGVLTNPDTLIYVLGGFTWFDADSNVTDVGEEESVSETFSGYTLGAGLDVALGPMTTGRIQYRYSDYEGDVLTFTGNSYDMEVGPTIHELTAGVSWYF